MQRTTPTRPLRNPVADATDRVVVVMFQAIHDPVTNSDATNSDGQTEGGAGRIERKECRRRTRHFEKVKMPEIN
jgi:hypothetical protein